MPGRSGVPSLRNSPAALACGLLAAALDLGGGGAGAGGTPTTPTAPAATPPQGAAKPAPGGIGSRQIERTPSGTPERALLEWWRDVQVNDPEHARGLYAEPPTLPNLAGQFNYVAGRLDGSVKVLASEPKGDRVAVRVRWRKPGGEQRRVTMRLTERGGEWKLLDARFLDEMVAEMQAEEGQ